MASANKTVGFKNAHADRNQADNRVINPEFTIVEPLDMFQAPSDQLFYGGVGSQFLHGFPVLLATAYEVGGLDLAMRANALLGGLALMMVFGFAQLLVRPWLAVLAQVALASNLRPSAQYR